MDESGGGEGSSGASGFDNSYNLTPQDVLLALPGLTTKNYRLVSNSVRDLKELCDMTQEEMNHLIGVEAGRRLYAFLHKNVQQM